ncbi:hypothetical protein ASG01_08810 [Chryseobacterium sp. Leaf180]|uniref:hypothetical protein n=1 Tax=Chryseobacterium sp. Leaf180 TaxID=1736289 RepID=UPI0006F92FD3|nr:hypothetical protein [Chryseobacterium sp. Leaf180]KQR93288.1 hypothetical protein ASG01_08810 [Chryseobacterium sp. Leaf180]
MIITPEIAQQLGLTDAQVKELNKFLAFINVKSVSELLTVMNPANGFIPFEDADGDLKKIPINIFFQLIGGLAKPLAPDAPAPTVAGWYKPTTYSEDPGTNYPNAGNLKAVQGFDTLFYFDGSAWLAVKNEIDTKRKFVTAAEYEVLENAGNVENDKVYFVEGEVNEGIDFKPYQTSWDGDNFLTLSGNTIMSVNQEIKNAYLLATQDSIGGRTLTVEGLVLNINLNPNKKTLIGYVIIGTQIMFSVNPNVVQSNLPVPVFPIIPTFTNAMAGFSTISPGVYKHTQPMSGAVSNETLNGDGYIEFGANTTKAMIFGFDTNNTANSYGDNGGNVNYKCFVFLSTDGKVYTNYAGMQAADLMLQGNKDATKYRLNRIGNSVTLQKLLSGNVFTDIYTFSNSISGNLYIKLCSVSDVPTQTESLTLLNL